MADLDTLATPWAAVDLDILEANARFMAERCSALGVRLRPHVKTHKCVEAARIQVRGHFGGLTVSTLAEARFFAANGFEDITYAVPISPNRLEEAAHLSRQLKALHLVLDSHHALAAARACAGRAGLRLSFFLKVDCGYHRAGVDPAAPAGLELARALAAAPEIDFRGLLTHAGHSYDCQAAEEIRAVAAQEREVLLRFAETLRGSGVDVPEVSIGSTPTLSVADAGRDSFAGITEVRPGNYLFYDAFQAAIGSCGPEQIAFSVLATVIGRYSDRGELLLDAGGTALSRDPGPTHLDPGCGFGLLADPRTGKLLPELSLVSLSQEHGKVRVRSTADLERFPIGSLLRILPNHACLAAAGFSEFQAMRGANVVERWRPIRGW